MKKKKKALFKIISSKSMAEQNRLDKINVVLQKQLGLMIEQEIDLKTKALITITNVETLRDLSSAKVFISVVPDSFTPQVVSSLNAKSYIFHQMLNRKMRIRKVPRLLFLEDKELKEAERIDNLLKQVEERNKGL